MNKLFWVGIIITTSGMICCIYLMATLVVERDWKEADGICIKKGHSKATDIYLGTQLLHFLKGIECDYKYIYLCEENIIYDKWNNILIKECIFKIPKNIYI